MTDLSIHPILVPQVKVVIVLAGFPLLYLANSFTPWSKGLFVQLDRSYRRSFLASIHALHWMTTLLVLFWLYESGIAVSNLGLNLNASFIALGLFIAIGCLIAWKSSSVVAAPGASGEQPFYKKIAALLAPNTRAERFGHVALCITSGFCEEFLYRGFGITALLGLDLSSGAAVVLTSMSFTLIHGRGAFSPMGIYWVLKGALYGGLFLWSESLFLVVMLHALWNFAVLLKRAPSPA